MSSNKIDDRREAELTVIKLNEAPERKGKRTPN